tara:strand:- start:11321 stop:11749 length:429 start_codon:yes stop_codon:yes gene_type:complete
MKKKILGRPKKLKTANELWIHFEKYVEERPLRAKPKGVWDTKNSITANVMMEVPLTWLGFSSFLNTNKIIGDINDYKTNKDGVYNNFSDIIKKIDTIIKTDMIEGATAGVYKENIIARMLGLADKQENKVEQTITINFTDDE